MFFSPNSGAAAPSRYALVPSALSQSPLSKFYHAKLMVLSYRKSSENMVFIPGFENVLRNQESRAQRCRKPSILRWKEEKQRH